MINYNYTGSKIIKSNCKIILKDYKHIMLMSLTIKTYLTPSIPEEIFQIIANYLEEKCQVPVRLILETTSSGPKKGESIKEDLSFMCTPPYYWLNDSFPDEIELLPYAPVFNDKRNNNQPLYFSDILVHPDSKIGSLDDLNNDRWAYNDTESLSGYFCIKNYMNRIEMICSGSHLNSIKMVTNKEVDITCIDSNVLPFVKHNLKLIGTFGPHPVQPGVLNKNSKYKEKIIRAFEDINNHQVIKELNKYHINKFEEVNNDFYFKRYSIRSLLEI